MNSVRLNNICLKYLRFTPLGCKDIGIKKFDLMMAHCKSRFIQKLSSILPITLNLGMYMSRPTKNSISELVR